MDQIHVIRHKVLVERVSIRAAAKELDRRAIRLAGTSAMFYQCGQSVQMARVG